MRLFILLILVSFNTFAEEKADFHSYELLIQSDEKFELAAWQVELHYDQKKVKLTGIEGGEKPFIKPTDYDTKGLLSGKIILASFTLKKGHLEKEYLVAKIHAFGPEDELLKAKLKLVVAANSKGKKIQAKALLRSVNKE